jgi:hypothetical protein
MRAPSLIEQDYHDLGWTIDDPRLAADDAWALTAGGQYDPAAQVNITSVQVVRDRTVVVITLAGESRCRMCPNSPPSPRGGSSAPDCPCWT